MTTLALFEVLSPLGFCKKYLVRPRSNKGSSESGDEIGYRLSEAWSVPWRSSLGIGKLDRRAWLFGVVKKACYLQQDLGGIYFLIGKVMQTLCFSLIKKSIIIGVSGSD